MVIPSNKDPPLFRRILATHDFGSIKFLHSSVLVSRHSQHFVLFVFLHLHLVPRVLLGVELIDIAVAAGIVRDFTLFLILKPLLFIY